MIAADCMRQSSEICHWCESADGVIGAPSERPRKVPRGACELQIGQIKFFAERTYLRNLTHDSLFIPPLPSLPLLDLLQTMSMLSAAARTARKPSHVAVNSRSAQTFKAFYAVRLAFVWCISPQSIDLVPLRQYVVCESLNPLQKSTKSQTM